MADNSSVRKQNEHSDLVYGLEEKPPVLNGLLSALTHLLALLSLWWHRLLWWAVR